ncbi:MAG: phosphocholine cytidylyltransferase family protein [Rhodospirillaceae bacterium]|jgi:choline kinase|nr:phosphocholine cytidylyltransferase family protein [Rhodospirillaceae bacterium]
MKALMLAAGLARRLYGDENEELPKALLRFEGQTLLERHVSILRALGVDELMLVVGHRQADLLAEAKRVAPEGFISSVFNPRFAEGPILSLACGAPVMRSGSPVIFMDADVLYPPDLLARLVQSPHPNCFIMDREFQSTDDFVRVCLNDGKVVDFGKQLTREHDAVGEWPGFMKMSAEIAGKIADRADEIISNNEIYGAYERAMCDVLLAEPVGTFGHEDITGTPWIEIDYPEDLDKAETKVIPKIAAYAAQSGTAA